MIDRALKPGARYTLILIAVGLVLFFWRLGGHDLWPSDEPRFALQAWEMQTSGDYVVPTINTKVNIEPSPNPNIEIAGHGVIANWRLSSVPVAL